MVPQKVPFEPYLLKNPWVIQRLPLINTDLFDSKLIMYIVEGLFRVLMYPRVRFSTQTVSVGGYSKKFMFVWVRKAHNFVVYEVTIMLVVACIL